MRYALLALIALLSVAHAEQPLLVVGGDGHAYAIGPGAQLLHVHHGQKREISIPLVMQLFPGRTGAIVTTQDQVIWLVERGEPTEIATGVITEIASAPDGTYLYVWEEGGIMSILYVP